MLSTFMKRGFGVVLVALLLLSFSSDAQMAESSAIREALDYYAQSLKRPSLNKRAKGIATIARTKSEEAADMLFKRYEKPQRIDEKPPIYYLLADAAWRLNNCEAACKTYGKWLKKFKKRENAWLHFNLWRTISEFEGHDEVGKTILGRWDPALRASALEAIARTGNEATFEGIISLLGEKEIRKDYDRKLIVGACASALYYMREKSTHARFKDAANSVINQLASQDNPMTTKVLVARHLAATFGQPEIDISPGFWRTVLDKVGKKPKEGEESDKGDRPAGGTKSAFVGIKASGGRVVFLIDASTSMLQPLSAAEREAAKGGGNTGKKKEGEKPEDELPWNKINNRWDLAREYLKIAIKGLGEDVAFAVVLFHKEGMYLKGFDGMHYATDKMKGVAISQLDAFKPPKDTKKGVTNVHDAYMKAFRVLAPSEDEKKAEKARKKNVGGGVINDNEHVDENGVLYGADTIFLLSDGAPTWDNWVKMDKTEPGDTGGDPEKGTGGIKADQLYFQGPYAFLDNFIWLVRDIQRMNLLRKAELHCVGIGEARKGLLDMIASVGLGKVKMLGTGR